MGRTADLRLFEKNWKWRSPFGYLLSVVRCCKSWGSGRRSFVMVLACIAFLVWMFHPDRHACGWYSYVSADKITGDILTIPREHGSGESLPPCPWTNDEELPSVPQRPWTITTDDLSILTSRFDISPGGQGRPTAPCQPQVKVAIIVPYRNRPDQLNAFLWYMHHFLSMQYLDYSIIIVEQSFEKPFNRAKLFNVGYAEALALDIRLDCFIFHDVDLLPERLMNIYGCSGSPRHLISSLNTFRYTMQDCHLFGGAVAMTKDQFEKVNGMSNRYYGWGGEDDDFRKRVIRSNLTISHWDPAVARYTMMIHEKEPPNPNRKSLLEKAKEYAESDGLLSLNYKRLQLEKLPLYTRILVDL